MAPTIPGVPHAKARRQSDLIKETAAANVHHAIRQAEYIGYGLNLFASINFSLTNCPVDDSGSAFAEMRHKFGHWIQRPRQAVAEHRAPATFVWVRENPDGCQNAHWMLHVPLARQNEFERLLYKWLDAACGGILSDKAIHIRTAATPMAAEKYLLKGMHPAACRKYGINHEYQGWVMDKRLGYSLNIGPKNRSLLRELQIYPPSRRWYRWGRQDYEAYIASL